MTSIEVVAVEPPGERAGARAPGPSGGGLEMDERLLRKIRRAELRKKRVIAIVESDGSEDKNDRRRSPSRQRSPSRRRSRERRRSKGRRRRRRGSSSSEDQETTKKKMLEAAMQVKPGPGSASAGCDLQTGGLYGCGMRIGMGPAPSQPNAFGGVDASMKVCVRYLQGECQMPEGQCSLTHPTSPAECSKWMIYFNRTPCKYGDACHAPKCIFDHPNRRGFLGQVGLAGTSL
uniref:C3H1-type domain-containing protein n=1 Tax=Alexandrium catenella TaxID=2925 RepID=A0A7S1W3J5_ALECA